jgi:hypothetical protein
MAEGYNPIVRTFNRLRAVLVRSLGLPRQQVHPSAELASLIPVTHRRQVWRQLRRRGLRVLPLTLAPRVAPRCFLATVTATAALIAALWPWTGPEVALSAGLAALLPLGVLAAWAVRPWAVCFPLGLRTVGELVLSVTSVAEHKHSGYRWTRREIGFRVRLLLAYSFGLPLEKVLPEMRLDDVDRLPGDGGTGQGAQSRGSRAG